MTYENLRLKPIEDSDIDLFSIWLSKDYILKWYECPEDWINEVKNRKGEFSYIKHFIVLDGNKPIGFCQYYDCFYAKEDWYEVKETKDAYSIDYLIGEEEYLKKGYGKEVIRLLKEKIKRDEKCKKIIVQPDKENIASNKLLLSTGFIFDEKEDYYCILI